MRHSFEDADTAAWQAYIQDVTPLGEPEPSQPPVPQPLHEVPETRRLDLHGFTLADAHAMTMGFVTGSKEPSVTIVTGLSGAIKREFPLWLEPMTHIRLENMPGGGSYRLHFRKRKNDHDRNR
jgi:hypothetical protein